MKILRFLLRQSKGELLLASVIVVVSGFSMTGLLFIISQVLRNRGQMQSDTPWIFFGVCLVFVLTRILSGYLITRMATRSLAYLRLQLTESILAAPLRTVEELGTNRLLPALTTDIARINGILMSFPFFLRNAVMILCCLVYMAVLSWFGFLIVFSFIAGTLIFYYLSSMPALAYQKRARHEWDVLFGHLRSLVHGIKEFKQHAKKQDEFVTALLKPSQRQLNRETLVGDTIQNTSASISHAFGFVAIGMLFFLVPLFGKVSTDVLISYAFILVFMFGPLEGIIFWLPELQTANVSMITIEKLGLSVAETCAEKRATKDIPDRQASWTSLEFKGVTHSYFRENENACFNLGPIDVALNPGDLVFVVGGNGSGKTTLVKVLTGLYSPESGGVYLNGELVSDADRDGYRQLFSAVFSDFHLHEHLLGLDQRRLAHAEHYLIKMQLNHKVKIINNKFSTIDLSQGQRKRLALLTVFLEDRPIYVFDEWAADQDPYFKEIFYKELLLELKSRNKTVIVVSHDDKYYHLADRIIKLDYGHLTGDETQGVSVVVAN